MGKINHKREGQPTDGENIYKLSNQQGINLWNLPTVHVAQNQTNNTINNG